MSTVQKYQLFPGFPITVFKICLHAN